MAWGYCDDGFQSDDIFTTEALISELRQNPYTYKGL